MTGATSTDPTRRRPTLWIAAGLALGAAVSLGLARFSYALLLPPMRADLGWSYLTAGAMNTLNAAGYLIGALLAPRWIVRHSARRVLLAGGIGATLLLAAHGAFVGDAALYLLRTLTGVASAAIFVSGGLLAARLGGGGGGSSGGGDAIEAAAGSAGGGPQGVDASRAATSHRPPSAGLVLGLYYGGTGVGIVASALVVPPLAMRTVAHAWQSAWWALGAAALVATGLTASATRRLRTAEPEAGGPATVAFPRKRYAYALASYFLFGLGYIGYMTFVVTLLREQGLSAGRIAAFYTLLGLAVIGSSFVWAGLLQRHRGGGAMRLLNGLVALATLLPVLGTHPVLVFASGLLFGGVFLSVVASTTALVRHNAPPEAWSRGIGAFTAVFAAGQIVGPSLVGWLADGRYGLRGGLACSAAVLLVAALLAGFQRPVETARA